MSVFEGIGPDSELFYGLSGLAIATAKAWYRSLAGATTKPKESDAALDWLRDQPGSGRGL